MLQLCAALVKHTLKGALQHHEHTAKHKAPLMTILLQSIITSLCHSCNDDDMLFLSMLNTGFSGLFHLGEMAVSDISGLQDFRKVVLHRSLDWMCNNYKFTLPAHKADTMFEANQVHIAKIVNTPDPQPIMFDYISSQDQLFPLHPQLWLHANGFFIIYINFSPLKLLDNPYMQWCYCTHTSWSLC